MQFINKKISEKDTSEDRNRVLPGSSFYMNLNWNISDKEIEKIAIDLIEWAKRDDSVIFSTFATDRDWNPKLLSKWADKNETMREALEIARHMVSARREERGIEGEYNSRIVMGMMPLYNREYREYEEQKAAAQKQENLNPIKVIIERVPSSDIVPEKKELSYEGTEDEECDGF